MEKRLKRYLAYLFECQKKELRKKEKARLRKDLLIQIEFFQHERLVHLIVTVMFAVLLFICIFSGILCTNGYYFLILLLLLVLLIPYIRHYYILENGVQKLYQYYDSFSASDFDGSKDSRSSETEAVSSSDSDRVESSGNGSGKNK